jgi:hypothetical protein
VTIAGRFVGAAPYFAAHVSTTRFHGLVWFLADTGASRTTILDRDFSLLRIPPEDLQPSPLPMVGIGGSVRAFSLRDVELVFAGDGGEHRIRHDLWVVRHDLERIPPEETARILRLPSVLGRDIINRFRLDCDYRTGRIRMEVPNPA